MRAIVEWGKPGSVCKDRPCGVSGQFITENPTRAVTLAAQLFFVLTEGRATSFTDKDGWHVSKTAPRKTVWAADRSAWVSVSLLDGVMRGAYAGTEEAK